MGFLKTSSPKMELKIYPLLCSESRKALLKTKRVSQGLWRSPYNYEPNGKLLTRLSTQLQMTKEQVREELLEERKFLLSERSPYAN